MHIKTITRVHSSEYMYMQLFVMSNYELITWSCDQLLKGPSHGERINSVPFEFKLIGEVW